MAYQVIARKYRPQRFADVVGQEHVTQTLTHAIQQNRIAHAYLFAGPRGTGKTTIARIFAKCLNCVGGPKVDFADDDPRCAEISEGRSLDVLEIDGASNRGIDEIRDLRETVKYAPAASKFKVYIIDEVHMLTKEAFNALLKTLEEPPAHVQFMFATTEPEKVLPTILSRCQRFDLRRIPAVLIVKHLGHIARQEKVQVDEPALQAIARGAEGGMRDAESTLDQLISFCGDKIVESDVLSMFGLTAQSQIHAMARMVLAGEIEPALRELNDLARNGKDLGRLLSELLNHFRNLLIHQVSHGDLKLLEITEAEAATLAEQSTLAPTETLTRMMEVLTDCERSLRDAVSKKILLEVTLLKTIQARQATSLDTVLKYLQQLRDGNNPGVGVASTPSSLVTPRPSASPAPKASPANVAPRTEAAPSAPVVAATGTPDLEDLWTKIVEGVGRVSAFVRTYLLQAHPVSLEKNVFTIGFDPEFADNLHLVDNAKNRMVIQTKLQELGHGNLSVKFIQAEAPAGRVAAAAAPAPPVSRAKPASPASPPEPANAARKDELPKGKREKPAASLPVSMDDFKNDPLIKQALEIFKGQIVDVRP
ncbi:MAG: DNA polymerase III subunit gamma/tau [Limisphaerales bacterium]